jgi:hypothetical protein
MKLHYITLVSASLICSLPLFSRAQSSGVDKPEPVSAAFEHGFLINNQTVTTPLKNSLDVGIQHRFGVIDQPHDMYGIYAPANIRLYIGYGITKDISVGIGSTKAKENYDLSWKYTFLRQMTSGMPVTISYFGNIACSGVLDTKLLNQENKTLEANRLSYFNEIMVARKFNSHLSLQAGVYYSYYNIVDSAALYGHHGFLGVSAVGRYKFSPQSSVLFEYNFPLGVSDVPTVSRPKPNIGIGLEVSTGNHQFQIFLCNANGILGQETGVYNLNDYTNTFKYHGGIPAWIFGFNITRNWGFGK